MYVCMYVRTYVCLFVCMYVCLYVCMFVCFYVCMYVCMFVCMYVCMFVCMYVCLLFSAWEKHPKNMSIVHNPSNIHSESTKKSPGSTGTVPCRMANLPDWFPAGASLWSLVKKHETASTNSDSSWYFTWSLRPAGMIPPFQHPPWFTTQGPAQSGNCCFARSGHLSANREVATECCKK